MNKDKLLSIMGLVEAKEKRYTTEEIPENTAYIFKDLDEFNNYFVNNGVEKDKMCLVTSALITILNDGRVFAFKNICDFIISEVTGKNKENNKVKVLIYKN